MADQAPKKKKLINSKTTKQKTTKVKQKRIYKKRRHQGVVGDFRWPNMCAAGVPENRKRGEEQQKHLKK